MRKPGSLAWSVGVAFAALGFAVACLARPVAPALLDVAQISAGGQHSCVLSRQGRVSCWGANLVGQLGQADTDGLTLRLTPVPVPGLDSGIRSIASGDAHNCAITAQRGVMCWGLNGEGALGSGSDLYANHIPTAVIGLGGTVEAVSAGSEHSCALLSSGAVQCWGNNAFGQLGDGTLVSKRTAVTVQGLPAPALQIDLAGSHSCARLSNGETRCWGRNESGQLGDGSQSNRSLPVAVQGLPASATDIAASVAATCALVPGGVLYCWGAQYPLTPFDGGALQARAFPGFEGGYIDVEGGVYHLCALNTVGAIKCLGENAFGQYGNGPVDGSANAEFAIGLAAGTVQLTAGGGHTCAVQAGGGAQCWGDNRFGQLGIDATSRRLVPTQVLGLDNGILAIGSGGYHGCALTTAGAVKCWGANGAEQVGDGTTQLRLSPVDVPRLASGVRALAVGVNSSCAITQQGRAQCWGANYQGQLGIGSEVGSSQPAEVAGLGSAEVTAIDVGRDHGCALLAGGSVSCWGSNEHGQLGNGGGASTFSAVAVSGLGSGVQAISTGWLHSCAITAGGGLKCWGYNENGQLGDGSSSQRNTPIDVLGLGSGVIAVSAGAFHTCAVRSGGAVSCWGDLDGSGLLLGDGSGTGRSTPSEVPALSAGVVDISASFATTCVRLQSGAMKCWGANDGGDIGDNTSISRPLPVDVPGVGRGASDIDGSYGLGGHTCAVISGGAKCWGENTFAQLGDGSTFGVPTPQTVLSNEIVRRVSALAPAANAEVLAPQFDASGRFMVFESSADNLVDGDSNGVSDIFLLDRESAQLQRISLDTEGAQLSGPSQAPSISADGQRIVFVAPENAAARLQGETAKQAETRRKDEGSAVLLRNLLTGSTQRIGPSLAGSQAKPQIAAHGGAVVWTALPSTPQQGVQNQANVFSVALSSVGGAISVSNPQCLSCKSVDGAGSAVGDSDGASLNPVLSADGQWVAYQSVASNVLAGSPAPCPSGSSQVILRNLLTGSTQRISPPDSLPSTQCGSSGSLKPSMDYSGNVIAFESDQALSANDGNTSSDAYVWRAGSDTLLRASQGNAGSDTVAPAFSPQVSGDGKQLAFVSAASNLDVGFADNNEQIDLHAVALEGTDGVLRLSRTASGAEANADSETPVLNYDGSQLGFVSSALNLGAALTGQRTPFARDNPLSPSKRSATWWIADESGWGLTVFDQGNLLAPTWFTYDVDGEPTWFIVAGAFPQGEGRYRGELYRFTGTPLAQIEGPAARTVDPVGVVELSYLSDDRLQFDYSVDAISQSKILQRFPFGNRGFVCSASAQASRANTRNFTDLWSGAGADAGWGLTLFHVDGLVVAIWYTYDVDGEAVFFVITTTLQADGSFAGEVFRQRDGTPFSDINGALPSADADPIGSARFVFSDGENAQFSYTINGVSQTRAINRLLVGDQASECRAEDLTP